VDIENRLPVLLNSDHVIFDDLRYNVSSDYYLELIDYDGSLNASFGGVGKRIGVVNIDIYKLTNEGQSGSNNNYSTTYNIIEEGFEADLHMSWDRSTILFLTIVKKKIQRKA
jgi:hypothetical protein